MHSAISPPAFSAISACAFGEYSSRCDVAMVYLIRIYTVLLCTIALAIVAVLHCQYSFVIPFVYRMVRRDCEVITT